MAETSSRPTRIPARHSSKKIAKTYFDGVDPVGKAFDLAADEGGRLQYQIVGYVRDVRYRNLREPILPQFYVPFHSVGVSGVPRKKGAATLLVRTSISNACACGRPAPGSTASAA